MATTAAIAIEPQLFRTFIPIMKYVKIRYNSLKMSGRYLTSSCVCSTCCLEYQWSSLVCPVLVSSYGGPRVPTFVRRPGTPHRHYNHTTTTPQPHRTTFLSHHKKSTVMWLWCGCSVVVVSVWYARTSYEGWYLRATISSTRTNCT